MTLLPKSIDMALKIAQAHPKLKDTSAQFPIIPIEHKTAHQLSEQTKSIKIEAAALIDSHHHSNRNSTCITSIWKSAKIKSTTKIT